MFSNAGSFFSIAMYDAIKNNIKEEENNVDKSGDNEDREGNRKAEGQCDRDVRAEENRCSKEEPPKNKTTRTVSKKKPIKKTGDKIDEIHL